MEPVKPVMPLWLSEEEVADLCRPLTQPHAQARFLLQSFGIECKRKPNGALLVFRHQLEPKAAPATSKPQPNRAALLAMVGKKRK